MPGPPKVGVHHFTLIIATTETSGKTPNKQLAVSKQMTVTVTVTKPVVESIDRRKIDPILDGIESKVSDAKTAIISSTAPA